MCLIADYYDMDFFLKKKSAIYNMGFKDSLQQLPTTNSEVRESNYKSNTIVCELYPSDGSSVCPKLCTPPSADWGVCAP